MSLVERYLLIYRLLPQQHLWLEADLYLLLKDLAQEQGVSIRTLVIDALYNLVYQNRAQTKRGHQWETLTPREQEVAALACLGYTNDQIAHRLVISINTVRSHMRSILDKYHASSKAELRFLLADWDFEAWLESQQAGDQS